MKGEIKLNKIEKCLIILARHIDRNPFNEYRVEEEVLGELGYEQIRNKKP